MTIDIEMKIDIENSVNMIAGETEAQSVKRRNQKSL